MSEKPKRSWFRFHLLTSVLMMCVAGSMLYLNMYQHYDEKELSIRGIAYGWPLQLGGTGFISGMNDTNAIEFQNLASSPWPGANYEFTNCRIAHTGQDKCTVTFAIQ